MATVMARLTSAGQQPDVTVVIPTRNRPDLLLRAVRSIVGQDCPATVEVVVVFDQTEPDEELRDLLTQLGAQCLANTRTPGLPGTRNTGILSARGQYVAFCDDDDVWHPTKLRKQLAALAAHPGTAVVSCGQVVDFDGTLTTRLAGRSWIEHSDFVRRRMSIVHSSSLVFERQFLLDLGMVDESSPAGQCEDWELILRASREHPVLMVDEPLVRILWGRTSFFSSAYETKIDGLNWVMERHPEIQQDRKGRARVLGQLSFWQACLDDPRSVTSAKSALAANPLQWRAVLGLAVHSGLLTPDVTLRSLHKFGRGV